MRGTRAVISSNLNPSYFQNAIWRPFRQIKFPSNFPAIRYVSKFVDEALHRVAFPLVFFLDCPYKVVFKWLNCVPQN